MSIRDRIIGEPIDPSVSIAAAMKAVESAQAALESAYVLLIATARGFASEQVIRSEDPLLCEHDPAHRLSVEGFGRTEFLCNDCGEQVSGE